MPRPPATRLVGLDVARCLALLGMVATHVLDARDPDGSIALGQAVAGGRASALFAVLAGVTLALTTGGRDPVRGRERAARSAGHAVRALALALLGLAVGGWETGIAVILTYYGLLFLCGLPAVGLRTRPLLALAAAWLVLVPVLSHLVRPALPARGFDNPSLDQLDEPGRLLAELALTGYYPVLPWLTYLFVGMALGRADLRAVRVQVAAAVGGTVVAVGAVAASRFLTARSEVTSSLLAGGGSDAQSGPALLDEISTGMYGVTPTGGPWEWLLVVAPHSATPFDLAHTAGSAVAVIGLALLLVGRLGAQGRHAVAIALGAGAVPLTAYTLHLVLRLPAVPPAEEPDAFVVHVLVLLALGASVVGLGLRGPLEWLLSRAARAASALVRRSEPDRPRRG